MLEIIEDEGAKVSDYWDEFAEMRYWLHANAFDRTLVNRRLRLYTAGDERWHSTDKEGVFS